jgi:membrane protease subunit (stomatin/prohibitin family)
MARIKPYLAQLIKSEKINIFEIDEHLLKMSEALHAQITPDFLDYGLALERFFLTTILKPEDDRAYQKFKELHFRQYADITEARLRQQVGVIEQETQAQRMIIEAQGLAQKRSVEGYTYQDERGFDVAERVASNEAVGQMTNLGVGLGVMAGVGGTVGGVMKDTLGNVLQPNAAQVAPTATTSEAVCSKCGKPLPSNAKFCLECGEKVVSLADNEMICPSCGEKTVKGKFCIECGASLNLTCPECGAEIPQGSKFCAECGHKLS